MANAADESEVKNSQAKAKRIRERELNDVRAVLSTKEGRRFFWRMLEKGYLWDDLVNPNPNLMAVNIGHRRLALVLWAELMEAEPAAYLKMIDERKGDADVN